MKRYLDKEGWEIKLCLKCGYALERCELTKRFNACPLCQRKNIKSTLVDRFVTHVPENKVFTPLA